jgi:hypothetical protein
MAIVKFLVVIQVLVADIILDIINNGISHRMLNLPPDLTRKLLKLLIQGLKQHLLKPSC